MSLPKKCGVCRATDGSCPHCTDLNRAIPMFTDAGGGPNMLQEFQFLGHDETVSWLINDGKVSSSMPEEQPMLPPPFDYLDCLRDSCNPCGIGSQVWSIVGSSSDFTPQSSSLDCSVMGQAAASSGGIMTLSGSSFTDPSSTISNETDKAAASGHGDATMEREARVMRYKEKKKRRKFEKQIRYASRKAYAEMRPRIKGRFAKTPEGTSRPSEPPHQYNADHLQMGWFHR